MGHRMNETSLSQADRVPLGIPGFDELCEGGLLRNRTYLLSGTSGAGKTNFGIQYLYRGVLDYGEPGILITTEERPRHIRDNVASFGWDLETLEDENTLAIVDACSTKIGIPSQEKYVDLRPFDMRSMLDQIISIQEEIDAKRAVVDSSTSIGFYIGDVSKIRLELLKLSTTLEILGLTSILTCEIVDQNQITRFGVENFVVDGVIVLYYKQTDNTRIHSLEIYKMRGTSHSNKIHPYEITPEGLVIHPREEVYQF